MSTDDTGTSVSKEDQAAASEPDKPAPQDNATEVAEVDPEEKTKAELQELAEKAGVAKTGNKDEIAARINAAQGTEFPPASGDTASESGSTASGRGVGQHRR